MRKNVQQEVMLILARQREEWWTHSQLMWRVFDPGVTTYKAAYCAIDKALAALYKQKLAMRECSIVNVRKKCRFKSAI